MQFRQLFDLSNETKKCLQKIDNESEVYVHKISIYSPINNPPKVFILFENYATVVPIDCLF